MNRIFSLTILISLLASPAPLYAYGDLDQYMLEFVNRARANPQAEADRYSLLDGDLNEGLEPGTITATP
ncbi:hypothetical protein KAI87_07035, partial [Myxococcota bacterium]|nr:hypothetical protein [Myxococcota bacterium]